MCHIQPRARDSRARNADPAAPGPTPSTPRSRTVVYFAQERHPIPSYVYLQRRLSTAGTRRRFFAHFPVWETTPSRNYSHETRGLSCGRIDGVEAVRSHEDAIAATTSSSTSTSTHGVRTMKSTKSSQDSVMTPARRVAVSTRSETPQNWTRDLV